MTSTANICKTCIRISFKKSFFASASVTRSLIFPLTRSIGTVILLHSSFSKTGLRISGFSSPLSVEMNIGSQCQNHFSPRFRKFLLILPSQMISHGGDCTSIESQKLQIKMQIPVLECSNMKSFTLSAPAIFMFGTMSTNTRPEMESGSYFSSR